MSDKVIKIDNEEKMYRNLADEKLEQDDLDGALGYLFKLKNKNCTADVLEDIADVYADMELYELSNQYWFYYLQKAAKNRRGEAYEELAVNYFYMDNLWASSFYLNEKLSVDGLISNSGASEEILSYFADFASKKNAYKLVYPQSQADYSNEISNGKRAIVRGDFEGAASLFSLVPLGAPQFNEAQEELSVALFLKGEVSKAITINEKLLVDSDAPLSVLCNLASMYKYKKDKVTAKIYYEKAIKIKPQSLDDEYKIATCSLEQDEHAFAERHIDRILDEKPFDLNIRFLRALARLNQGKYNEARLDLSFIFRINPCDLNIKYYATLATRLELKLIDEKKVLPLKYTSTVPQKEYKRRAEIVKKLYDKKSFEIDSAIKNPNISEVLEWSLYDDDRELARQATVCLATSNLKSADNILLKALQSIFVNDEIKRIIIYILVAKGYKDKITLVSNCLITKVKPSKLKCEKKENGELFFLSYALCFSRLMFFSLKDYGIIAIKADEVYEMLSERSFAFNFSKEELAAAITCLCKLGKISEIKNTCKFFKIKKERLEYIIKFLSGDKNDKDN